MNAKELAKIKAAERAEGARRVARMARAWPDKFDREQLALLDQIAGIVEQEEAA